MGRSHVASHALDADSQTTRTVQAENSAHLNPSNIRLRHSQTPHQQPSLQHDQPDDNDSFDVENPDFQVVCIPDRPDPPLNNFIGSDKSSQAPLSGSGSQNPPLPQVRSSVSVDKPYLDRSGTPEPGFSELVDQKGIFAAITTIFLRFIRLRWGLLLFLAFIAIGLALLGIFAFDPLSWKGWLSFAIFTLTLALLISNSVPTPLAMVLGLVTMLVFKIVTPDEAIEGFANIGVMSVAILYIVAEGIQRTSVLTPVFRILLGKPRYLWEAQLRLMIPVGLVSAFLNNTPLVAMLIPVVRSWSRRAKFPISKLLMPMNNAAVLGGTLTLLGTSTNLVVDGLARKGKLFLDESNSVVGLPIFGVAPAGVVSLIAGVIYMVIFSRFLLRERDQSGVDAVVRNPREYTVAILVLARSPVVGDTIEGAGLRQLQGLYLVEVTRADGTLIPAVDPDTKIEAGDILVFAGVVETVTELYHIPGLVPATGQSQKMKLERHHRRLVELVISSSSLLVGQTAKEAKFRSRFSAAIIAVHRHGEHVIEKIADIKLRPGDALLVEAGPDFILRFGKDSNFALVSEVSGSQPPREDRIHMTISATLIVAMIVVVTTKVMPLLAAASVASLLMIATGCLTLRNAVNAIDLGVVVTVAASFGISNGMSNSGAAEQLANFIVSIFKPLGAIGLLFGIYVSTALLSSVITNNAAVALMFPVITGILKEKGYVGIKGGAAETEILRILYALMLGASASFSTPIGYQTNLMVHGPGGYTFMDWVVFGFPMQIILCLVGVFTISRVHFSL